MFVEGRKLRIYSRYLHFCLNSLQQNTRAKKTRVLSLVCLTELVISISKGVTKNNGRELDLDIGYMRLKKRSGNKFLNSWANSS